MAIASRFGKSDKWAQRMRKEALARSRGARGGTEMNMDAVTVQDCIEMLEYRGMEAVIGDGRVVGFQPAEDGGRRREW